MAADAEATCPVDHKTRDAWLAQARAVEASKARVSVAAADSNSIPNVNSSFSVGSGSAPGAATCPVDHAPLPSRSWTQTLSSYFWTSPSAAPKAPARPAPPSSPPTSLDPDRVVSSIPRSVSSSSDVLPVGHGASANAANHEIESGVDASGNWVYPSEKMFFDAMKRKGYDARVADMKTVVPIHNAVNERAWKQIQEWEAPYLAASRCGGPKLESFANKSDRMTPTARINTLLGYTSPFDRHDWIIDRCGTRIDYVIDFYAGRSDGKSVPSFYLDVRPKLNTWEGVKMRTRRWVGMA